MNIYFVSREQLLGFLTNKQSVLHLKNLLQKYEETKKLFDNTLKKSKELGQEVAVVTSEEILGTVKKLYGLKHCGQKIKELYECQQATRSREHQNTDYVHSSVPKSAKTRQNSMRKGKGGKSKINQVGDISHLRHFCGVTPLF